MGANIDHVDPYGPTTLGNLVTACVRCNTLKGVNAAIRTATGEIVGFEGDAPNGDVPLDL